MAQEHSTRIHNVRLATIVLRSEIDKAMTELIDFFKWYCPDMTINFTGAANNVIKLMDFKQVSMIRIECLVDRVGVRIVAPDYGHYVLDKIDYVKK